ncbi:DoxX family protein [Bacillus sp. JJ1764]
MKLKNEIGAFMLRVVLGGLFLAHGIVKFQGGIENIVGWFSSIGLPGFMAYAVALIEIIGGIALIIGFATRYVSALYVVLMIGAILKVKLSVGLMGNGQMAGYELDLSFLAIAAYLAITNKSFLALDNVLFRSKKA